MRLRVRSWGTGERTALLVHGFSDDAETWWRVGPAIAELGYTVLAPDLRGHGASPRGSTYSLDELAQDLVDTFPPGLDVAIGHSLGAIVLGMAAPRMDPRRLVYLDPSWLRARGDLELDGPLPTTSDELPVGWSAEDLAADLASSARMDPAVAHALLAGMAPDEHLQPPPALHPGTLVVVPERSPLLPLGAHVPVQGLGYRILTQPGVGHVMHRDDFDGFMALLRPQLADGGIAA